MKERKKQPPKVFARRAFLFLVDAVIVAFSFYFALLLRADGAVEATWWPHNRALLYHNLPWIVAVYLVCFLAGGLYSILWKYAGERDLIRLAGMIGVPTVIVYLVNRTLIHGVLFNSANVMAAVFIFLLVGGSRLAWRLFLNHPLGERLRGNTNKDPNRPVMIVGAGEAGAWAINVCKSNKEYGHAVVAVDDDPAKLNQTIHGVPVKGTLEDIPELCTRYGIHSIIIAIPTLKGSKLSHVIDLCVSTHCAVQVLSDPQLVGSGAPQQEVFRELNPADFLSREEVTLDTDKISGYLTGKTVLVTGGGGSIGSELCRQIARHKPRRLVIFAAEDVGNADPRALQLAVSAMQAVEMVGLPEARIILSQAVTYCATAPKSNASLTAIEEAMRDVEFDRIVPVPAHLRDAHYRGAAALGSGIGYRNPHDHGGFVVQEYLGVEREYYRPADIGYETKIKERCDYWKALREYGKNGNGPETGTA